MSEGWDKFKKLLATPGNALGDAVIKGGNQSSAYTPTTA